MYSEWDPVTTRRVEMKLVVWFGQSVVLIVRFDSDTGMYKLRCLIVKA
jgi:hypothetical protein